VPARFGRGGLNPCSWVSDLCASPRDLLTGFVRSVEHSLAVVVGAVWVGSPVVYGFCQKVC
jgi:hypothetical protein